MGFKEEIQKLIIDINERKPHISNEEQTKLSLITPFLKSLGYDISNPLEVKAEFTADYGKKAGTRVDYAILKAGKPIIFIEAKPVDSILTNYDSQLEFYFNSSTSEVRLGILTNGEEYRFFTDLKKQNKMDEKPFYTINFGDFREPDLEFLSCLKKDTYDNDKLSYFAETLAYTASFNEYLKSLFNSPSDEFVRSLIKNTNPDVIVTSKLIERFRPIIKKSINTTILDMVSTGLLQQGLVQNKIDLSEKQNVENSAPTEPTNSLTESEDPDKSQIVTTDEELTAFSLIKTILERRGKDTSQINYIDTINYFSINNPSPKKWFIRLVIRDGKKSVAFRLPIEKANSLGTEFKSEIAPNHLGGGVRVYFDAIKDLYKMQDLIVSSFEELNQV